MIIASIAATTEDGLDEAAQVAQDDIVPALLGIEGVASVDVTGGEEQRVLITLDPQKLTENGVSHRPGHGRARREQPDLPVRVRSSSDGSKHPGLDDRAHRQHRAGRGPGRRRRGAGAPARRRRSERPGASIDPIRRGPGRARPAAPTPVTIGDLGTVELKGVATTGYARTDGKPALSLSGHQDLERQHRPGRRRRDRHARRARRAAQGHRQRHIVSDLSRSSRSPATGSLREGGLGALFAVLTIFLFLFSIRSTIVAAVSIPLSILAALVIMQATGITLNIMTLGGLAVAVGRVVDDAIVVLENIYRHRAHGREPRLDGVDQRPQGGRGRDHRGDGHDGRRVPAARLRRRHRVASSSSRSRSPSRSRSWPRSCAP